MDSYGFYTGRMFDAYEFLGAHVCQVGTVFRTFAPNAAAVSVIGDFNDWNETPMQRIMDQNFFECYIPNAAAGMRYKYKIHFRNGGCMDHCDPYGFGMELRPANASIIRDLNAYTFTDQKWQRNQGNCYQKALNIYEVHLGSWHTKPEAETVEDGWYSYKEIAEPLIAYVKENGYNYIEFMPLSEHPCDESWGYQNTGFFSPTSRYGDAAGLMQLIDQCHANNIGVIMDFVPVHFAVDAYALANYDGTPLYEYPNDAVGISEWGSHNFMHSRGEVRTFLQSAAHFWLKKFHFDGIRMDAISRIIYWHGDENRGVNGNAIEFIKYMNQGLKEQFPGCILMAEDSTNFPKVTAPVEYGGLGFDYKWDMGWMNDTLDYFKKTPEERIDNYHKLTFSMMYHYQEHYMLPFSHDEVVHGKATIVQKMYDDYDLKFPQARALYMYMYAHPGKKLNFMGNEIGQLREWDEKREQDWDILKYPNHDAFHHFMTELNQLYLAHPALYAMDLAPQGFTWIDCNQTSPCVYAFYRTDGTETIAAVFNFYDKPCEAYALPHDAYKNWKLLLCSDWDCFGGTILRKGKRTNMISHTQSGTSKLTLPPYSAFFFQVK